MRQFVALISVVTIALLGFGTLGIAPSAAQEATPALTPNAPGETVSLRGADIYYEIYGAGDPVILVHGAIQSGLAFVNQISALVDAGYQVIVIDGRGHGRSTHGPEPLSYDLMASDVLGVMDHLGIDKAAVVGWSMGATISLDLAIHHPERLTKVVSYGGQFTPGYFDEGTPTPEFDAFLAAFFEQVAADYQQLSPEPEHWDALLKELGALDQVAPNFSEAQLQSISVPVLILDGAEEEVVPHDQPIRLAELIRTATLVLMPDVGHFAPIQQPEEFNRIVLEFLAS
jgi:pimeloyl-ACP methyl ester carboxylesterase